KALSGSYDGVHLSRPLGLEELGNSEIEELGNSFPGNENVARLQIPMYDEILVSILNCLAYQSEQSQSLADFQGVLIAVLCDGQSCHILHHEIRKSGFCSSALQKSRDKRMLQIRQDLPLQSKTA